MKQTTKIMSGAMAAMLALVACEPRIDQNCQYSVDNVKNNCREHSGGVGVPIFIAGGGYYYRGYPQTIYRGYPVGYTGPILPVQARPPNSHWEKHTRIDNSISRSSSLRKGK